MHAETSPAVSIRQVERILAIAGRTDPHDAYKDHDGDRDGVGCEKR